MHPVLLGLLGSMTALQFQMARPAAPLATAAFEGRVADVQKMLALGAPADGSEDSGFTPLMWAARGGQVEAMKVLVDAGAQLDRIDRGPNGWTPIMHALHKDQTKAAKALLGWGANPNAATPSGETPLMRAVCQNNPEMVRALLERGADPHAETLNHMNVLTFAVNGGSPEVVRIVLEKAPDLRWNESALGTLGLWFARLRGQGELVSLIEKTRDRH
jgi:ankyrin repeat protein